MAVLQRTCAVCSQTWLFSYSHGRPPLHCETCAPEGWRISRQSERVRLVRRLTPVDMTKEA
jgi:hypothetical protein